MPTPRFSPGAALMGSSSCIARWRCARCAGVDSGAERNIGRMILKKGSKNVQKGCKTRVTGLLHITIGYYRDVSQISGIVMKKMWALDLICADVNVQNLEAETSHGNPWEPWWKILPLVCLLTPCIHPLHVMDVMAKQKHIVYRKNECRFFGWSWLATIHRSSFTLAILIKSWYNPFFGYPTGWPLDTGTILYSCHLKI